MAKSREGVVVGLDLGTSGARAVAVDPTGRIVAEGVAPLPAAQPRLPEGWFEQEPADWWAAACSALAAMSTGLGSTPIRALSASSTSGTVCLVDANGAATRPALMYSDTRARAEAEAVQAAGQEQAARLGYRFSASFALPRLLWLARQRPAELAQARWFLSPTDYLLGRLGAEWGVTDWSNALKTGYDLLQQRWPPFIASLGLPVERFPAVVAPGTPVGRVSAQAAAETDLPVGTPLLAGATDGCASQFSTGAVAPGEWNSTLGTTLVVKGVSAALICDPLGRIYSHRHPEGYWLPGGASTTGGEAVTARFGREHLARLDAQVLAVAPTPLIVYPLARRGERFPFAHPSAEGFTLGASEDPATLYAAHLEGVAYVERLAYDVLAGIGFKVGDALYTAGGANRSAPWLQLRADITGRRLSVPQTSGAAMGAAVLAAARVWFGSLAGARSLVRIARTVEPRPALRAAYDERYGRFVKALEERGYVGHTA